MLSGRLAIVGAALCARALPLYAQLPTGGSVAAGAGSIQQHGAAMTIQQSSQKLGLNWQSFNIGAGNSVNFVQPNASSVALNRVLGNDASTIFGSLQANGSVFLVNPSGVLFAPGAQVNVGGLVASTLNLSDADFAAGTYLFSNGGNAGSVINQGHIQANNVALLGPQIVNSGVISAPGGGVALAAGDAITVKLLDSGLLTAHLDRAALNASIQNHGQIIANGGQVQLLADAIRDTLINTDGLIQAKSLVNRAGRIYLSGGSNGTVTVSGTLDTSGSEGGSVTVLGKQVGLLAGAKVDASGDTGGGTVLVGGNWHGEGPEQNASATYMDRDASIHADATGSGKGGEVVLWSNDYTGFYGLISAKGGPSGGQGGAVETSSHNNLQAFGVVDASAGAGPAGSWLLDPFNVTIGTATSNVSQASGNFTATGTPATIDVLTINSALNAGTAVTVDTGSSGAEAGNITVSSAISKTAGANTSLTLNAAGGIAVNAGISSSSGQLATTLNANGGAVSGAGAINTNGGLLTLNAASGAGTLSGAISGIGGLTKTGAGTTMLTGANTYIGATTVNAGTLQIGNGGTAGALSASTAVAVASGATLVWNNNNTLASETIANTISGAGTVMLQGQNSATAQQNSLYYLSGNNAGFTGNLQVNAALLRPLAASALGSASIDIQQLGQLWLPGNFTIPNQITIEQNAGWWNSGNGGFVLGAIRSDGNSTFSGNIFLNDTSTIVSGDGTGLHSTYSSWSGGTTIFSGVISGPGGFKMSRYTSWNGGSPVGSNVIFSGTGSNTYTGATVVDGQGALATLTLAKAGGAVAIAAGDIIQLGSNTGGAANLRMGADNQFGAGVVMNFVNPSGQWMRFDLLGTNQTLAGINAGTVSTPGGAVVQDGGYYTAANSNGTLTLNGTGSYLYNGYIRNADGGGGTGILNLVQAGAGSQALEGGSITHTGTTMVNAGTLDLDNATGYNSATSVAAGAVLTTSGTVNVQTGANALLTLNGGTYNHTSAGFNVWLGGLSVNADSVINVTNSGINNQLFLNGPTLSGSGALTINNTGSTTTGVRFRGSAASTYSGALTVNGGSIGTQGNVFAFDHSDVTLNAANWYMDGSQFATTAANDHAKSLNGNGNVFTGNYTLTVGTNNGSGSFAGVISGSGGKLVKTGTGTQILTGNNTYTGATTVGTGTLQVGNGGTAGALGAGAVTDNASLVFTRSDAYTIPNAITGTGNMTATSGSNLTIGGAVNLSDDITLTAGSGSAVASTSVPNGSVTGGDVVLNAAVSSTGAGKTVTIYSGNATTALYTAKVSGSATSLNKAYATAPGGGTVDSSKKLNVFYRVSPTATVGITASNKVYDATTAATVNTGNASVSGTIDGDSLSVSATAAAFSDPNAGTGKTVTVSGVSLASNVAGVRVSGYQAANTVLTTANITPAPLTVQANNDAKFVTLSDNPGYAGVSYSGFVGGETSSVLGTGGLTVTRSNAGTQSAGAYNGVLQASGVTSSNYGISYLAGNYTIVPANQLLVRLNNATSNYGTTPTYSVQSAQYMQPDNSIVNVSATVSSGQVQVNDGAGGNVAFGIAVNGAATSTSGALRAGSYQLGYGTATGNSANFSNNLTVVGSQSVNTIGVNVVPGGVSKVYDGNTSMAGLTLGLSGTLTGDVVTAGGHGSFSSKNVGSGLNYTVSNLALTGMDAGNYFLNGGPATLTGSNGVITPAALTLTASSNAKTYDATNTATAGPTVTGLVGGDTVTGLGEAYADKNAGTGKTLAVNTGYVVNDGNGGGNYTITAINNTTGVITPAALTLTASSNTKTYDATTSATAGPTVTGLQGADTVTGLGEAYADKNAGTGKTLAVNAGYVVNDGNGGNNYAVATVNNTNGVIDPLAITVTAVANSKVYDGATSADAAPQITAGSIATGDASGFTETYNTKNVGTGLTLTPGGAVNDGNGGANYAVTFVNDMNGVITPLPIQVALQLAGGRVYDAATIANSSDLAVTNNVDGSDLILEGIGTIASANAGLEPLLSSGGNLQGFSLSGSAASNYTLFGASGSVVVRPRPVNVIGSRMYDGTAGALASLLTVTNPITGETVAVTSGSGTLASKNIGAEAIASMGNLTLSSSNYTTTGGSGTVTISPAPITVAALPNTKKYDSTTSAAATPAVTSGSLMGTDSFSTLSETYGTKNAGTNLTLTPNVVINDGNGGNNYVLTSLTNADGVINKAALLLVPNAVSVPYTGIVLNNTAYSDLLSSYTLVSLQGGDTLGAIGLSLTGSMAFNGSTATIVQNPGAYLFGAGTLSPSLTSTNYTIAFSNPSGNAYMILAGLDPTLLTAATIVSSDASNIRSQTNAAQQYFDQNPSEPKCLLTLEGGSMKLPSGLSNDSQEQQQRTCRANP